MGSQPLAFISYRRTDASQAALALNVQLRERFGPGRIFMDVGAISVGDVWPERLRRTLDRATALLVVIGPGWLTAADRFGRRRLDQPDDWVRNEIVTAIGLRTPMLPLLVGGGELPPREGLPEALLPLLDRNALPVRHERWDADVDDLVKELARAHGFIPGDRRVMLPQPEVQIQPLSERDLATELETMSGWEPVESVIPGDYPNAREELRKAYRFRSFKRAIEFMSSAVETVQHLQHHPRWENQWRTVTVHLSTWDIGNRISALDIQTARSLDALYNEMRAAAKG